LLHTKPCNRQCFPKKKPTIFFFKPFKIKNLKTTFLFSSNFFEKNDLSKRTSSNIQLVFLKKKKSSNLFPSFLATPPEEAPGSSYSGEVSPVLPSLARYGVFFDASRVLEFDLKSRVEEVNQALDLGDAHGLKSPKIGPRPLQVYQRSRGRLPKPSKPSGPLPVTSIVASLEAGSPEAAAMVPAAVGSNAAPPVVPVVRGKHFFFPSGIRGCSYIRWSC
jgi:hypothetical protein